MTRYGAQFGPDITFLGVDRVDLDDADALAAADVVIVGKKLPDVAGLPSRLRGQMVIDLVGVPELHDAVRPWAASVPLYASTSST